MKIAVYANEISQKGSSGVKTYSLEIINNLLKLDSGNSYRIYSSSDISSFFCSKGDFVVMKPRKFWAFTSFARRISKERPDMLFMPIQTYPFLRKSKIKTVVTVHDLAFLLFPKHFSYIRRKLLSFHTKRAVLLSDKIIVPSVATKNDILRFYSVSEDKISVVYHGFSSKLVKIATRDDKRVFDETKGSPYALFVGTFQPRKNIFRLVKAFEGVKKQNKDIKLVLCGGKGWLYDDIYKEIEKSAYRDDIILSGDVSDDLLASFYRNALFFVFPSLYEGFGLPIIEAMSFSLPVVCSKNSSISEITSASALYFDEYRISDMTEKMLELCNNESLRSELSQKSSERKGFFSWKKSAEETAEVLGS